jgi:UDPglucose--hexose-1-phosphate uridylyltransferase
MAIQFGSVIREARVLSPLTNFEPISQTVEHRRDPLTGRSVIVLKGRLDYVRRFIESDGTLIEEMANSTKTDCPFCPDSIRNKAPKFPPEISGEGRIRVGEAVCFPSLFAHEDFNAIVVPTGSHSLQLNQISPAMFVDAFKACVQYFELLHTWMPTVKYDAIAMNFLPPAGSTVVHPHIQTLASDLPFQAAGRLLIASKSYFEKNGSSYWEDLLETEERLGVRYLREIGRVSWLTPYAPLGMNDCQAIVRGTASLDSLSDYDLTGLVEGLGKVLKFYYEAGVRSFNLAIFSGPFGESLDYFDVGLRIVSRYGYKSRYVSDVWALQYLLGEQEVYESPEETCLKLKKYFD